jgi:hypothetical protein
MVKMDVPLEHIYMRSETGYLLRKPNPVPHLRSFRPHRSLRRILRYLPRPQGRVSFRDPLRPQPGAIYAMRQ